jgi:hypothetical protein
VAHHGSIQSGGVGTERVNVDRIFHNPTWITLRCAGKAEGVSLNAPRVSQGRSEELAMKT